MNSQAPYGTSYQSMYWAVAPTSIHGILDIIRTNLVALVAEMRVWRRRPAERRGRQPGRQRRHQWREAQPITINTNQASLTRASSDNHQHLLAPRRRGCPHGSGGLGDSQSERRRSSLESPNGGMAGRIHSANPRARRLTFWAGKLGFRAPRPWLRLDDNGGTNLLGHRGDVHLGSLDAHHQRVFDAQARSGRTRADSSTSRNLLDKLRLNPCS